MCSRAVKLLRTDALNRDRLPGSEQIQDTEGAQLAQRASLVGNELGDRGNGPRGRGRGRMCLTTGAGYQKDLLDASFVLVLILEFGL